MHLTKPFRGWAAALLCLPFTCLSQDVQWERSYGGKHADYLFDAVATADYGFILAGSSLSGKTGNKASANGGNLDYALWKMDEKGELSWQKSFGGPGIDLLQSVRLTPDGGFILAGTSNSRKGGDKADEARGDEDFWIVKLDASGGEQWQKTIGGYGPDRLTGIVVTSDGGYLLGGTSASDAGADKTARSEGGDDLWLVRLDKAGNIKWQRTFGGRYADELRSLAPTADGGFIVGAFSNSPESGAKTGKCNGEGDFWILKLDRLGAIEWQRTYGGEKDDQLTGVLQTKDGNYIAGGYSLSGAGFNKTAPTKSGSDLWLIKMDMAGNSLWQESYDFGKYDILTSLVENEDATLLLGARVKSGQRQGKEPEGTNDYLAVKVAADGRQLWDKTVGSEGEDVLQKLITTRDGGYVLAGTANPESGKGIRRTKKGNGNLSKISNGKNVAAADRAQRQIDGYVNDTRRQANDVYKEQVSEAVESANDALGTDSPLKIGAGDNNLLNPGNGKNSGGSANGTSPAADQKKLPASRQKSTNYGRNDFWVVKLKDKDKKEKARQHIEAVPNPAQDYTNIVVGYEFDKGTATVFDLSGRQLQSFAITERTVPVDLHGLPEGIYIVNIRTDKSDDSVKVMKSGK